MVVNNPVNTFFKNFLKNLQKSLEKFPIFRKVKYYSLTQKKKLI